MKTEPLPWNPGALTLSNRLTFANHLAKMSRERPVATPPFLRPEFLKDNLPPSVEIQRMIQFNGFSDDARDSSLAELDIPKEEIRFIGKLANLPWEHEKVKQFTTEKEEQFNRFLLNIEAAQNILIDGYGDDKRRTREHTFIHPLRVFLRGLSEIDTIGLSTLSTYYTSLLTRILHDAQEDFFLHLDESGIETFVSPAVHIDKKIGVYSASYLGSDKVKRGNPPVFFLKLEPHEKDLLEMQLDAVSIPPDVEQMTDRTEKAKRQVQHLLNITEKINRKYGPMAAYQTLRIKLDDRIDNVSTYYATETENSKEKLFLKLQETITFFRRVEKQALRYDDDYRATYQVQTRKELPLLPADESESIVQFCYYLLLGGGYDEIFQGNIDKARKEIESLGKGNGKHLLHQFLIPTLNPEVFRRILTI